MIPVNKPYLPAFGKYTKYLERVYDKAWLTNNGPLVQELKIRLEEYLGVKNLLPVANGTLAMQLAYKVFNLKGEIGGMKFINWLSWDSSSLTGTFLSLPERDQVPENIKEQLIVELYSK